MKCVYTRLLSDEELRAHLERGDVISFKDVSGEWHQIERQVERLGFGDVYAVSRCTRRVPRADEHQSKPAGDAASGLKSIPLPSEPSFCRRRGFRRSPGRLGQAAIGRQRQRDTHAGPDPT